MNTSPIKKTEKKEKENEKRNHVIYILLITF
jgi:hypothetical protein